MIYVYEGLRINDRIKRAVATTVDLDAPYLTHMFYSDYITIQFNNDNNDFRMFYNKDEYIDYLIGMYQEGGLLGHFTEEYRSVCELVLMGCKREAYLRGKLEFTFEEMQAISKHYGTRWFSKENMARWETQLIKTLPFRMFITTDKGYDGSTVANLRIMAKDGYIVTLANHIPSVDVAIEMGTALVVKMDSLASRERAILADLTMVWDTSRHRDCRYAFSFEDSSNNSFTLVSDNFVLFSKLD